MYVLSVHEFAFAIKESLSRFFRLYGRGNFDEPLKGLSGESMRKSIDVLAN